MDVIGPYCVIYPKIIPQNLTKAITDIQIAAAKHDFARIKKEASGWYGDKSRPSIAFLLTEEWQAVRLKVLEMYGRICMKCGSQKQIQVDHIKPKSKYPRLALEISNLQVLCWPCNKEKSYLHETDYRPNV